MTASFEVIGVEALRKLLPAGAEVHVFGASSLRTGRFGKSQHWDNLLELEKALRGELRVTKDDFPKRNPGDGGLDLVGWLPIGDHAKGMLVIFGQCACTEIWDQKQYSSGSDHWGSIMTLSTAPRNVVFIPLCTRKTDGHWHRPQDHSLSTLVVDRFRLLHLLRDQGANLISLPAFAVVEGFLGKKEPVT